jgi:Family of unknown function (DUF5906)/RepB DNA-primase N-terminal domain/Primase C terminal 1 (PriCT-1)
MTIATQNKDMTRFFLTSLGGMDDKFAWRILPRQGVPDLRYATLDEIYPVLEEWNNSGAGIFVAVNETDGKGQRTENITRVRALFADLDGCPLSNIGAVPLEPHLVIETSPKKYHAYWLVDGLSLDDFKPLQQTIAAICSSDPVVCDLPRIMRVPGFHHHKGEAFLTRILEYKTHAPFGAKDVLRALPRGTSSMAKDADKCPRPRTDVNQPLQDGERTVALAGLCGRYIKAGFNDNVILDILYAWNSRNIDPLPNEKLISTLKSIRQCDERGRSDQGDVIETFNQSYAVVPVGGKTVVIRERGNEIDYMSFASFRELHCNLPKVQGMPTANYWLTHPKRRSYSKIIFDPSTNATNDACYNLWRGFATKPQAGDCTAYLNHIKENIASGDKCLYHYILDWMADGVQNPHRLPGVALVLRGKQGSGKGIFATLYGRLFGIHFKHVQNAEHLTGRFTKHLADAVIIFADEVVWGGNKQREGILKTLITENQRFVEPKGKDAFMVNNYARVLMATNENWAVPAGAEERRFCVIDVGDERMQDTEYFGAIAKSMENGGDAALLHFLLKRDISNVNIRSFPKTNALLDQKERSLDSVPHWWLNCLKEGRLSEFKDEWPESASTTELYEEYDRATQRDKFARGRPRGSSDFVTELKKWVPIKKYRPSSEVSTRRPRGYKIPPLEHCRQAFEKHLRQEIPWPD